MSGWKTLLSALAWPAAGAVVGAALGAAWSRSSSFSNLVLPLLAGLVVLAGAGFAAWRKQRANEDDGDAPSPSAKARPKVAPDTGVAKPQPRVSLRLPDIESGLPDVWGIGDALRVEVATAHVSDGACRVLAGSRELAAGDLDPDGRFVTAIRFDRPGTARLRAEAGGTQDERPLRVVDYGDEITSRVDRFRVWAMEHVPGCRDALTIREVSDAVADAHGATAGETVAEIVRIYELVSYGERVADRALFVGALRAFGRLEAEGVGRVEPATREA